MPQRQGYVYPIKQKVCAMKNFPFFPKTLILMTHIYLPVFPCGTNQKLYITTITPKLVKKLIINFDSSKVPGPDYIPVVVQKKC